MNSESAPNTPESQVRRSYGVMYYVNDRERSREFYQTVLDRPPSYDSEEWIEFDLGDQNLCLQPTKAPIPKRTPTRIILEVDNLDEMKDRLDKKQIKIVDEIQEVRKTPGRFMNIEDPDGNIIGIYSSSDSKKA